MRKKELIRQNLSLFEELQKAKLETSDLKKQLKKYSDEIDALKSQLSDMKSEETEHTEPMRRLEEKVISSAAVDPDMDYGAKAIGKIVVSAANYSNRLTADGNDSYKELVNLILGKTEIAKSEILAVVESDNLPEQKASKIDAIVNEADEYFKSVSAQIQ